MLTVENLADKIGPSYFIGVYKLSSPDRVAYAINSSKVSMSVEIPFTEAEKVLDLDKYMSIIQPAIDSLDTHVDAALKKD